MNKSHKILCIGEVLWDSLPSGLYLGGAPLNVSYHLSRLGTDTTIASRVGNDRLGHEAIRRIKQLDISTDLIQRDEDVETGFVSVELSESGEPDYSIVEPAAWDHITQTSKLQRAAAHSWGLVFGSLAQRTETSRQTIQALWQSDTQLIFDVNLREPFVDKGVIYESLKVADIIKMNEAELNHLIEWFSLSGNPKSAVEDLVSQFQCSVVCITRGSNGAVLFYEEEWFEHAGFPVKTKDEVGAGDAFLAALLGGIIDKKSGHELLAYANATGSLIAQKDGAMPEYSIDDVKAEMT